MGVLSKVKGAARAVPGAREAHRILRGRYQSARLRSKSTAGVFTSIYEQNGWTGNESVSGPGSDDDQVRAITAAIPGVLDEHGVTTMLDIPCGDFRWMSAVDLGDRHYTGADIVADLIAENRERHGGERVRFEELDLLTDELPSADLVLCRDCLVHFSYRDIAAALRTVVESGSTYLLTTTFTDRKRNVDIATGRWRPLNLQAAPFGLPSPLAVVNEQCTEGGGAYPDKSLALWRVVDLTAAVERLQTTVR